MNRGILARLTALGAVAILLNGCPTTPTSIATTLELSVTSIGFDAIGAIQQVTATVKDQRGQEMEVEISWSSNSAIVTIIPSGSAATVAAAGIGSAVITVTAGSLHGTIDVQVSQVPVAPIKLSGDLQSGVVGTPLAIPLQVRVQDRLGVVIANHPVSFTVSQGGGSVAAASVASGADGIAATQWTLGTAAGSTHQVIASVSNGLSASFGATAGPGAPAELVVSAGQGQIGLVGAPLPVVPAVLLRDGFGNPVPAVPVSFLVTGGGGSVGGANPVTSAEGVASAGGWILGTLAGPNTLTATAPGLPPLAFSATGQPGPPANLVTQAGQGQSAPAGSPVPIAPAVKLTDQFGNPISGVPVSFTVTGGGGSVSGGSAQTGSGGIAGVTSWTLGPVAGPNTLAATVAGLAAVQFNATGMAVPASLTVAGGDNQSAPVGTPVPVPPSVTVRDAIGNPIAGVLVTFAVQSGGGSLTGGVATTGANGVAQVGSWTLGPSPGTNSLTATVSGLPAVTFTASGIGGGGLPTSVLGMNNGQVAVPGTALETPPSVLVRDAGGQPVAGVTVTFAITRGSGSLTGATATSNASGVATLGSWILGPGANCLSATVAGSGITGNPVTFVATGLPGSGPGYEISVQYLTCVTSTQEAAFVNAVSRWGAIITGDVADLPVGNLPAGTCGSNSPAIVNRTIDDLLIFATVEPIDGPGLVLGSAGPCFIRTADNLSVIGRMRFDIADINNLESNGQLTNVILHEMGHVLGIGTLWNNFGFLQMPSPVGGPAQDTHHNGPNTIAGFNEVGGATYTLGNKTPVENSFGGGTINAHWRESVLANELMTGFINSASANPLSALTIRSLADFNYVINAAAADPFFVATALKAPGPPEILIQLQNDVILVPLYTIDSSGKVVRVR